MGGGGEFSRHITPFRLHRPSAFTRAVVAGEHQASHRANTGEGFPAKTEGGYCFEIVQLIYFAGGMTG